jgi:hypothetical protein
MLLDFFKYKTILKVMEKITNRDKYLQNLHWICEKVELNQKFIDLLSNHPYFRADMESVKV